MKRFLKKVIAVVEVAAMSVTLMAGLSFGFTYEVQAAKDGTLTVNEEITVSSTNGESKSYTFVAPEDGTYYFTTTGEYDMYGELYIERTLCAENDDDGEGANFLITQTLTEGQECTIKFYEYDYFPFTVNLLVYDDTYGKDEVASFGTNNGPVIYCNIGDDATFNVLGYDMLGNQTDIDLDIYSFKWYKAKSTDESDDTISEKTDLGATGVSYTIDKIEATDIYDCDDYITRFYVEIYKNGECIDSLSFFLHNKAEYMTVGGGSYTLVKGQSVTFTPTARGYYGNPIDLSSGDYTFKWVKVETDGTSYEETVLSGTESTYTISEIAQTDFYEQEDSYVYYKVYIYINGREKYSAYFYIYDNVNYFSAVGNAYSLLEGDCITLTPAAYDHNGDLIDLSSSEYTFEWYKVKSGSGVYEVTDLEATELNYEISSIESSDFYEQDSYNTYYRVDIYKDEVLKDSSYFYIYQYDGSQLVIEDDVNIEGYQISQLSWGFRTVSSVEPEIYGREVVEYGNIYAIIIGDITEDDLYVGNDNKYVVSYKATEEGIVDEQYSESSTAINYVRTMSNNGSTSQAFQQKYMVRAYAKLADGRYIYSDAYEYSIFDVAETAYTQKFMSNVTSHNYIYENILKVVDSDYEEVEYNYGGTVVIP